MSLLSPADPAPFGEINPDGSSRILFVSDHHRNRVPAALGRLGLPDGELARHIGYDIGIADVGEYLSERFDAPLVHSAFSRLVIDCNRVPGTPGSIPEVSDGTRVPGNTGIDAAERERRRTEIFEPYHDAIRRRMAAMRAAGREPVMVALHSFTPVFGGVARPWQIGVLWGDDGRLAEPLIRELRRAGKFEIGDNQPYSGRSPAGYTIDHHAEPAGLVHVAMEFRQDLIADRDGAIEWARIFADALEIVAAELNI